MQLPEVSNTSNVVRLADGARRTRVLYAGDMEFAKAQFHSVAPQLQLLPSSILTGNGPLAPAETPDVALIDCGAPGVDARGAIEAIRARNLDVPIVLALDPGAVDGTPTRITAELRVDDYTVKLPGWLARLTSRLEFAIAHHRRRRSLDALQVSAERLRTVVETAPVCLARVTRDGTILAMNAAAMKMVNADAPEDVLGKSLLSFVGPGGADAVRRFLDNVSGGQPGSLEIETTAAAGARVLDTRAVPLTPDAEARTSALLVLRDATERKRLEESVLAAASAGQTLRADESLAGERDSLRQQLDAALDEARRIHAERDALRAEADEFRSRAVALDGLQAAADGVERQLAELRAEHQRVAAERDMFGSQREMLSTERNALVAERDVLAAERDALTAERSTLLADRDRLAAERDGAAAERNQVVAERDALAAERGALAAEAARIRELHDAALSAAAVERESQQERLTAAERERAQLASRCEALEALVASAEAQLAAERDEFARAREQADARIRLLQQPDPAAAEREALLASLGALREQFDEISRSLDAAEARHAADLERQHAATADAEARLREEAAARAALAAERDALQTALEAAESRVRELQSALDGARAGQSAQTAEYEALHQTLQQQVAELQRRVDAVTNERDAARADIGALSASADERTRHLQAALDELRGARSAQMAENEAVRRELLERVDDLQGRLQAVVAEREAIRTEMRLALDTAEAHVAQLQSALSEARCGGEAAAAEGDATRRALMERVEELQRRLDTVVVERESLESALENLRAEYTSRMHEAAAQREQLQRRIAERDDEYEVLAAQRTALDAEVRRARDEAEALARAVATASAAPAGPPAVAQPAETRAGLDDAQAAFKEAVQLLSGQIQDAVQATRGQQSALLHGYPGYDALEERLRAAEAECRRLAAERAERETTMRALQAEVDQLIEVRREQRKELVRVLQESDETERRAAERLAECVRLRHALGETQIALQRLARWASDQSSRLGPLPAGSRRAPTRLAAKGSDAAEPVSDAAAPGSEASWS